MFLSDRCISDKYDKSFINNEILGNYYKDTAKNNQDGMLDCIYDVAKHSEDFILEMISVLYCLVYKLNILLYQDCEGLARCCWTS